MATEPVAVPSEHAITRRIRQWLGPLTRLLTRPMSAGRVKIEGERVIEIASSEVPGLFAECCGAHTEQKRIDYRIEVNGEHFLVPRVWANVCRQCNAAYFADDVGQAISDAIFHLQYPREYELDKLLEP